MRIHLIAAAMAALVLSLPSPGRAADPAACDTVRMSDPGWTDITSTNALTGAVLAGLGYKQDVKLLSVPITYQAMKSKELDVFLGNWMPAQKKFRADLDAAKAVEVMNRNLEGAKFTLAVPSYVAAAGVKSFKDLAAHAAQFGSRIYGIEAGAPANTSIQKMIDSNDFGLKSWQLVASSEQGMLAEVKRATLAHKWIVFLAWAPHPMNMQFQLTYLSGGAKYFGPHYGGAEVYTLARTGFSAACPNLAKLFHNLAFTVPMENQMMDQILNAHAKPEKAAAAYLHAHPALLATWLKGVDTAAGKPGLPAVKASLGL